MSALAGVTVVIVAYIILWMVAPTLDYPYHETLQERVRRRLDEINERHKRK